jgi:orotidine-5'-phosphate decarboxylase
MDHFADRLLAAIEHKGSPVCVGLDPNLTRMPQEFRGAATLDEKLDAIRTFCRGVLEVVAPIVPAVKPQNAYFEALGPKGSALYFELIAYARELGLLVISDAKRGDIGSTSAAYAAAHLRGDDAADSLTVNGYFGADGTQPFVDAAAETGRGLFVLVRTSNPSGTTIQNFTDASGKMFYQHMAEQVAALGSQCVGERGYSAIGAVVGATCPAEARELRKMMPQQIFLVPGYGAQGATADDCCASFKPDGTGAMVNASRSVLYPAGGDGADWKACVETAAKEFAADIASAVARL